MWLMHRGYTVYVAGETITPAIKEALCKEAVEQIR